MISPDLFDGRAREPAQDLRADQHALRVHNAAARPALRERRFEHVVAPARARRGLRARQPHCSGRLDEEGQTRGAFGVRELCETGARGGALAPAVLLRVRVENLAARERPLRRVGPDDEAVAGKRHDRRLEPQLREALRARRYLARLLEHGDARQNLRRPVMNSHALARAQRARRVGEQSHARVENLRRPQAPRGREHHPPLDGSDLDAAEVDGRALPLHGRAHGGAVDLDAAHARAQGAGEQLELLPLAHLARDERPRDDRAEAAHREGAVDGQARHGLGRARGDSERGLAERALQSVNPAARARAHVQDGRAFQKGAGRQLFRLGADEAEQFFVNRVGLRDDDEAGGDAEQAADVEVLARLRHHALVGRDDERDEVDAVRAREHVLDEALVAGHVHEAEAHVAQIQLGEAEVDGDAAPLLFGQAVGVHARQSPHERGLAVVDVPRSSDDYRSHDGER